MGYLDKVIGVGALALGLLTLAGMLSTDAYSHGAQAEANSYNALTHLIANGSDPLCFNDAASVIHEKSGAEAVTQ